MTLTLPTSIHQDFHPGLDKPVQGDQGCLKGPSHRGNNNEVDLSVTFGQELLQVISEFCALFCAEIGKPRIERVSEFAFWRGLGHMAFISFSCEG